MLYDCGGAAIGVCFPFDVVSIGSNTAVVDTSVSLAGLELNRRYHHRTTNTNTTTTTTTVTLFTSVGGYTAAVFIARRFGRRSSGR